MLQVYTCQLFVIHRRDIFILRVSRFFVGTDNIPRCPTISEDVRRFPKTFRRRSDLWPVNQCFDHLNEYYDVSSGFPY